MDEKTEQLRDIFMDVSSEESVTESQAAGRGSLTDTDEATVEERLGETVARMRDRYDFRTDLDDPALVGLVRGFYAGQEDAALAEELGVDASTVREARLDLHLLRETDDDAEFDTAAFRKRVVGGGATDDELAAAFDIDTERAARYRRVVEAQAAARGVSHRFTSEFEDALTEAGLATQMTAGLRETGLDEATEDIDSLDSDADVSM
ncbi:conditioned medium-induced protein 4 [Haloarcula salinisoli]|uniref:Conditioned medium-induced protein 4 n=1 Tax=Haloarcula salinisoli TaxID=2487746 RepID=A0A8J8C854_9EURY|nr:conditioned medium-induced protein 4 [Halomicroarcula salinisoli]MBX0286676.1 conditioned medium-induced protein 4 [Halomicroarcula salinisoli]MBX0303987.1 conditioned medium-induced protein 4 [Halomicroarcula salinisoli]